MHRFLFASLFFFLMSCASRRMAWDPMTAEVHVVPQTQIFFEIPGIQGRRFLLKPADSGSEYHFSSPLQIHYLLSFTTEADLLLSWKNQSIVGHLTFCAPGKAWVMWENSRGDPSISHANIGGSELCHHAH